jgi:hypothetical protein
VYKAVQNVGPLEGEEKLSGVESRNTGVCVCKAALISTKVVIARNEIGGHYRALYRAILVKKLL